MTIDHGDDDRHEGGASSDDDGGSGPGDAIRRNVFDGLWDDLVAGANVGGAVYDEFARARPTVTMGVLAEMLVQFFGAVPAVRRIRGLVPGRALQAVLRRHTDAKLGSMFGDDDDDDAGRSRLVFARDAFVAMSGDLFAGADLYPNAAAWDMDDTRLPLLRDISRVLDTLSCIPLAIHRTLSRGETAAHLLRKPSEQRQHHELVFLSRIASQALQRLGCGPATMDVVRCMTLRVVEQDDAVCREGDLAEDYFVVFDGALIVKRSTIFGMLGSVSEFVAGYGFGERSLMLAGGRRNATVIGQCHTVLGVLHAPDFRRLLYPTLQRVLKRKIDFFRRLPYMARVPYNEVAEVANTSWFRRYRPRDVIHQQGDAMPTDLFFVASGRVRIIRETPPATARRPLQAPLRCTSSRSTTTSPSTASSRPGSSRVGHFSGVQAPMRYARPNTAAVQQGVFSVQSPYRRRPRSAPNYKPGTTTNTKTVGQIPIPSLAVTRVPRHGGSPGSPGAPVFIECCVLGFPYALGDLPEERLTKVQLVWHTSTVAIDLVEMLVVPHTSLFKYASLVVPNLYRCPPDLKLRRDLQAIAAWDKYKQALIASSAPITQRTGFYFSHHNRRLTERAARPVAPRIRSGDLVPRRRALPDPDWFRSSRA
ncbi:Cyclic nucleotide-binding domain-containing protein [Plasmodiophora brassicae]